MEEKSIEAADPGSPVSYRVLETGVPVISSDGKPVGTVRRVVAAPQQDIFHGLVISVGRLERRFVAADSIASLHEHGVELCIDSAAARTLPAPSGAAPVYDEDPAAINTWSHWARRLSGRKDWHRQR